MQFEPYSDCGWYTADAVRLYFYKTEKTPCPPSEFECTLIGDDDYLNSGKTVTICAACLTPIGAGLFGEGRSAGLAGNTKWTGAAYKFGIYAVKDADRPYRSHTEIVIIQQDGSGIHPYLVRMTSTTATETWRHLCETQRPEMLWNICKMLIDTYHKGRHEERKRLHRLFLEGRLKKKRRNKAVLVVELAA